MPERLSLADLERIGAEIAVRLRPGDVIALSGDLGAGKSTLARAILRALGHAGEVPSPTFTLVQTYDLDPPVAHADLYRLDSPREADSLALDSFLEDGVLLLEWPERLGAELWPEALRLSLHGAGETSRRLTWETPAAWESRWPPAPQT